MNVKDSGLITNNRIRIGFPTFQENNDIVKKFSSKSLFSAPFKRSSDAFPSDIYKLWTDEFHGLKLFSVYQGFAETQKKEILSKINTTLLNEAYFIEKIGMAFAAKMNLLAQNSVERAFYCGIAGEEARHFLAIHDWTGQVESALGGPFIRLLSRVVENASREVLLFIVQVVLEGWGLYHYRSLLDHCCNDGLSEVFKGILKDEARHHGGGLELFEQSGFSRGDDEEIYVILEKFLHMVRIGPVSLVEVMLPYNKNLAKEDWKHLKQSLNWDEITQQKLSILRSIIQKTPRGESFAKRLHANGYFTVLKSDSFGEAINVLAGEIH